MTCPAFLYLQVWDGVHAVLGHVVFCWGLDPEEIFSKSRANFNIILTLSGSYVWASEFDTKQLKKAEGRIGRNVVNITKKMEKIVQVLWKNIYCWWDFLPIGTKHCNFDGRSVWKVKDTMLKKYLIWSHTMSILVRL